MCGTTSSIKKKKKTLPGSNIFRTGTVEGYKQQASSILKRKPVDLPTYGSTQHLHSSASTKITLIVI